MAYQSVFKRYELKYLITRQQKSSILLAMNPHMIPDKYGAATIRNIYFDTENYRLIRRSLDKPLYKEKLRIRSYQPAGGHDKVFVEIKKKYDSVVYKRRCAMPLEDALSWFSGSDSCKCTSQITREIDYFRRFYGTLQPAMLLTYRREAYTCRSGSDFRVTFDDSILCRNTDIDLSADPGGTPLLPDGMVLMELKASGGIPIWMAKALSENQIHKTSFSKYGIAYQKTIFPQPKEANHAHRSV